MGNNILKHSEEHFSYGRYTGSEIDKLASIFTEISAETTSIEKVVFKSSVRQKITVSVKSLENRLLRTPLKPYILQKESLNPKMYFTALNISCESIKFEEFVKCLHPLLKGTLEEQACHIYSLQNIIGLENVFEMLLNEKGNIIHKGYVLYLNQLENTGSVQTFTTYISQYFPYLLDEYVCSFKHLFLEISLPTGVISNKTTLLNQCMVKTLLQTRFRESVFCKEWSTLFDSSKEGLSFIKLAHAIVDYPSSTLLVIKDSFGSVFGVLNKEEYKDDNHYFGTKITLFAIYPSFRIYGSIAKQNSKLVYLNYKNKTRKKLLCFGGRLNSTGNGDIAEEHCRLLLDENFERCRSRRIDMCFEKGELREKICLKDENVVNYTDDSTFKVHSIEVLGFGGPEALAIQEQRKSDKLEVVLDRRKVDKSQLANNSFDREFLLNKTFQGSKHAESR